MQKEWNWGESPAAIEPSAAVSSEASGDPQKRWTLPGIEQWSTSTRTVFINALFLLGILVVFPVLIAQFRRDAVVIEPIAVPQALVDQGFTPEVAASRVWDGLHDARASAATSKETIDAVPSARQVEFSFPDSGFSIESLVFHLRRLFRIYETRVAGEFTCAAPDCERSGMRLRLRVVRDRVDVVDLPPMGAIPEREYFEKAAIEVYGHLDPFIAMRAIAETQAARATTHAYRLIRSGHKDAKWAYTMIGQIHAESGELATAIAEFRGAIALDRGFLPAHANLGRALLRNGDLDGAASELQYVNRRDPRNVTALRGLSDLALAQSDPDGAVAHLLSAAEVEPENPEFLAGAGKIELLRGREKEGKDLLNRALQLDPGFLPAFVYLALAELTKGDFAAAEKIYRNAADFSPDNAETQAEYGKVLMVLHRWEEAEARYAAAMSLDPAEIEYALEHARCLQALGRNEAALAELNKLLASHPARAEIHLAVADSLRVLDRKTEAIAAYRKFLELDITQSAYRKLAEAWIASLSG